MVCSYSSCSYLPDIREYLKSFDSNAHVRDALKKMAVRNNWQQTYLCTKHSITVMKVYDYAHYVILCH